MSVRGDIRNHLVDNLLAIRTEGGYNFDIEHVIPFESDFDLPELGGILLEDDREAYQAIPDPYETRLLPTGIHAFARWPTDLQNRPDEACDRLLADLERAVAAFGASEAGGLIDVNYASNIRQTVADGIYVALFIEIQYRTQRATPDAAT